jgi:hypothetical protein
MVKNWDSIVKELSSPDSSDAEDHLNVMSVQKNATRVAELLHESIPTLDASQGGNGPVGMNPRTLRAELAKTVFASPLLRKKPDLAVPPTPTPSRSVTTPGDEGVPPKDASATPVLS